MRLQPEELLQAGLGWLPLRSARVARRVECLARVLVHVVGVARRLSGCEEGKCVRCGRSGGEEAVSRGAGGEGHLRELCVRLKMIEVMRAKTRVSRGAESSM